MSDLFLKIINMSISASWLVLAVLLLRFVLKKAPKWVNVLLWGIVAVRLAFPFSIESALSLIPSAETISPGIMMDKVPSVQTGVPAINNVINPVIGSSLAPAPGASANPLQIWIPILSIIWVVGVAALLLYTAVSYWRLRRKVSEAVIHRDNIYQSENVASPFVLGMIKPKIYLPYNMDGPDLSHVVAHEQAHIRRRDHLWKPLGFLLLTVHWFNPLLWLAYVLLCRDIELACDEKVIKELGNEQRADYTQALVACSVNRRMIAACPLAFGEVGVKERVKSVMNYKKPAFWVIVLAVIVCVVVAVCFLTNPVTSVRNPWVKAYVPGAEGIRGSVNVEKYESVSEDFAIGADKYGRAVFKDPHKAFDTLKTLYADGIESIQNEFHLPPLSQATYELYETLGWQTASNSSATSFVSDFLDIYENSFTKDIPPDVDIPATKPTPTVTKWFDYLETPNEMHWDHPLEISLPEFPSVTFRSSSGSMEAVEGDEIIQLYTGMPIWSTYFCDLTGDGLPELCSSLSWGSGMIDDRVIIYDYANGVSYSMEDRGVSDYTLRQDESDGQLYVDKNAYLGGGLLSTGRLVFENGCIQVLWQNMPTDTIREIIDPTDDPNFAYDTAQEKFYEDRNNEYFFGGIYSQYVIVHYTDGTQEDIVTALNAGRAAIADLDKFGIRYWAEPKVATETDPLYAAITSAILAQNKSDKPDGLLHCANFVLLKQEELSMYSEPLTPIQVTVYGIALHQAYGFSGHTFHEAGGSHIPTAITFEVLNGEYVLKEYWTPRDGAYYASDIRDKFPDDVEGEALDTQKYILAQIQDCYDQAVRYGSVNTDYAVEYLFEVIESSPAVSSGPADYTDAHPMEYRELTYYGDHTLKYIFSKFLEGGQTGLHGHLMRAVLDDLAPEAQLRLYAETGQAYFDEWKAAAIRVSEQHDMEWIEKNQPAIFLLLQMLDE